MFKHQSTKRITATSAIIAAVMMAAHPAAAVDDTPATGVIEMWIGGVDDASPIIESFEEANPGVTVNVTAFPEESVEARILSALAAGTMPDIIKLNFNTQLAILNSGGFAPVPEGLVDETLFPRGAIDNGQIDGVLYAVPWNLTTPVLLYRKDLAEAAGVEPPTTWEELQTFAQALQGAGARFGYALNVGYDHYAAADFREFVLQSGSNFINEDGTAWTINVPENVAALDLFYGQFVSEGISSPDGPLFLDTTPWFSEGMIGSIVMGPWFRNWLVEANGQEWVDANLGAVPVPAGPGGSITTLLGNGLAVPTDAQNADSAWKLVRYLLTPESQVEGAKVTGLLPAVMSAWSDPTFSDDYFSAYTKALETAVPPPQVTTWHEVAVHIGRALEYVSRGDETAQAALDEVQARAEAIGVGH